MEHGTWNAERTRVHKNRKRDEDGERLSVDESMHELLQGMPAVTRPVQTRA